MEQSNAQNSGQRLSEDETEFTPILLEFQYTPDGRWFRSDFTRKEYMEILNSGILDGKSLNAVMIFEHEGMDAVYDFSKARQGAPAWRFQ